MRLRPSTTAAILTVCLALALATGWFLGRRAGRNSTTSRPANFAAAQLHVAPAVVEIEVASLRPSPRRRFRRPRLGDAAPRPRLDHSLGSGLVIDPRGFIVTNRHVVEGATQIAVTVPGDDHTYYAHLVGSDPDSDLALVKITPSHPLPVASLDGGDQLAVGDWVLAIGAPFGLRDSVSAGIVSALHRAMDPDHQFQTFVQTDAAINPGNSGGPLVDLAGNVVGINTAIYTDGEGYEGVGFALPTHLVRQVVNQLLRQGHVTRGSIGVYFESALDPAVRRVYRIPSGVPLSEVLKGGPAAKAGLVAGDVITAVNGRNIPDGAAMMSDIEFYPVGRAMQVSYLHDGHLTSASLHVGNRDLLYPAAPSKVAETPPPSSPDLGMRLAATPSHRGVRVADVVPDSVADDIGVLPDDIVLSINQLPVHDRARLQALIRALKPNADFAMQLERVDAAGVRGRWLVGGTLPEHP